MLVRLFILSWEAHHPCLYTYILIDPDHPEPVCSVILIDLFLWIQQSQIHLDLEDTTRLWHFQPSSHESLLLHVLHLLGKMMIENIDP